MDTQSSALGLSPWWHPVELLPGQCWRYAIGPLTLYLERHGQEWWLASEMQPDSEDLYRVESGEVDALPAELKHSRYVFQKAPAHFCLTPRLLDRPVVVKTAQPVYILPGETVTFYISTPVFVSVGLEDRLVPLKELPTQRLSDTWFGPSTRVGELCYASKSQARNSKEAVPKRPHRAVTPVAVNNRSDELLVLDKISIPVPFLAVYGLDDGSLWTDPVTLEHQSGDTLAKLEVGHNPPAGANADHRLNPARQEPEKGGLVRAFAGIFSDRL